MSLIHFKSLSQNKLQSTAFFIAMLFSCLTLMLTGCDNSSKAVVPITETTPTEDAIPLTEQPIETVSTLPADAPVYEVSTITDFEPFDFKDEYGNSTGFDIDLLNAIGEKAGFAVNYQIVPWEGIFDTVTSGKKDIIAAAVVSTPERREFLSFSDPYLDFKRGALVTEKLTGKSFDDLIADKTLKFSVIKGSSSEDLLKELGVLEKNIITENTQSLSVKNVITGKANAAFEDSSVLRYYAKSYAQDITLDLIDYNGTPEQLVIAVDKGNQEMLSKINDGLKQIKADGTYDKVYAKWFGK